MRHTVIATAIGLALGGLALGPALAPGFTLAYDMVFVPHPVITKATFGLTGMLPRHVPSDAVVAALSQVVPSYVVQKAILLSIFVLASVSAASLVPSKRLAPRLAAGVVYAWNPFVAERLLLGQWAFLFGYAALPWVAAAAAAGGRASGAWPGSWGRASGSWGRLVLALAPAAVGGFAAWAVSGLVALAVSGLRSVRSLVLTALALIVVALPWLIPSLLRGAPADPAGVAAFAPRADTPFGTLGSLLLLGGGWNAETVPPGYGDLVMALPWACVVFVALAVYACRRPVRGLGVAAGIGLTVAALGALLPAVSRGAIGLWPGFAVLRDGQQYIAPLAVAVAVGFGLTVDRLTGARREFEGFTVSVALVLPLVLLPGLAWGAAGRLTSVRYPQDWAWARAVVAADPGEVLVLPWEAYRSYPWNGGRRVLDPLPRFLPGRVVVNDGVRVGTPRGGGIALAAEDPRARDLDALVRSGAPLTQALSARGIRYVAVDAGADPAQPARLGRPLNQTGRLTGATQVVSGAHIVLYQLPDVSPPNEPQPSAWMVEIGWFVTFVAFGWSLAVLISSLIKRSLPKES